MQRNRLPRIMRMFSTPSRVNTVLSEGLKDTVAVASYLKGSEFAVKDIRRIPMGSTNFTYRLFLQNPYGQKQVRTAILKYAASHTADEPKVSFHQDRQLYEARAMTIIPWKLFPQFSAVFFDQKKDVSRVSVEDSPLVKIPELYCKDDSAHVLIMEDGTVNVNYHRHVTDEIWEDTMHSARKFFEEVPESRQKYATAEMIGQLLGTFLADLHNWGSNPQNTSIVQHAFAGNSFAKNLTIEETIADFWKNLSQTNFRVSSTVQMTLENKLKNIQAHITQDLETVAMGDFWPGNVLLSFNNNNNNHKGQASLDKINIIDWEFTMLAPAFLDVGHFIGEVFLIHFFESNDRVYILLLDSFMKAYCYQRLRTGEQTMDTESIMIYAGLHIIMALPRRIRSPRSNATKDNASACVEHALNFIVKNESWDFGSVIEIMQARRRELDTWKHI